MAKIAVLEAQVEHCRAEVYINDVPVTLLGPGLGTSALGAPIGEYLVSGANLITLLIEPGPTPSRAYEAHEAKLEAGATASAKIVSYEPGAVPEDGSGEEHAKAEWKHTNETSFPVRVNGQGQVGAMIPRWSWLDAPKLVLNDALRKEALAVIEQVHAAFAAGDSDDLLDPLTLSIAERAAASGRDVERDMAQFAVMIDTASVRNWKVPPLKPEDFDFRVCGGERLLDCVAKDWGAVIRSGPGPESMTLGLKLARIGGELKVVR